MFTGPHFNRPEGIIGGQYPGLFPVYVRMPARIVTVQKNQVAWRAGLHFAEHTLILIFENSGRTRAGYRGPPGNCRIFQNQRIRTRKIKIRAQRLFQALLW